MLLLIFIIITMQDYSQSLNIENVVDYIVSRACLNWGWFSQLPFLQYIVSCAVYGVCKCSGKPWPANRVRLLAHYTTSLSSLCRHIRRHWTCRQGYAIECLFKITYTFSIIFYALYVTVCLQLTELSRDDHENVYFILLYHQIGSINH